MISNSLSIMRQTSSITRSISMVFVNGRIIEISSSSSSSSSGSSRS